MDKLKAAYRRASIIGGAMISSVFIYAVIAAVIEAGQESFEGFAPTGGALLRNVFLGLSLFQVVFIKLFRSRMFAMESRDQATGVAKPPSLDDSVQRLMTTSIVTFAMAESIAVYGLVLFLLNGSSNDFYVFLAISLACFVLFFPRFDRWYEWIQKQQVQT
jgi:F0F1-type ATP synthase membrane subunit c/vacuolar-type H+-ATPase subunit K